MTLSGGQDLSIPPNHLIEAGLPRQMVVVPPKRNRDPGLPVSIGPVSRCRRPEGRWLAELSGFAPFERAQR